MQPKDQELARALRGGLRGRFQSSFHLLENALEVLDDQVAHCVTPVEYDALQPLLRQISDQLLLLQRLGEHAADAAIAPVLHKVCSPRPVDLLVQLREICEIFNEISLQEELGAAARLQIAPELPAVLTMGDTALINGLLANLLSNSLAAARPVQITLACEPGLFCYHDDGPGLPADAVALLREGTWSQRLLEQGGLGLPLIRAYAEAMNWQFTVEDGPGLCLRFSLPPCKVDLGGMVLDSAAAAQDARLRRRRYLQCELHPFRPETAEE